MEDSDEGVSSELDGDEIPYVQLIGTREEDPLCDKYHWITVFANEWRYMREYLRRGGDPNASDRSQTLMFHVMNRRCSLKFTILLLRAGGIVDVKTYESACNLNRFEHIELYLAHGFEPPTQQCIDALERAYASTYLVVTRHFCRKATITVLLIGKHSRQPLSLMFKIIARLLHTSRHDRCWILKSSDALPFAASVPCTP